MRPPRFSFRATVVRNQRIGRKRQRLVAEKQRQHVAGKCRAQGTGDRQGEEGEKAGLVFLVMSPHVADGIHRGRYPQPSGDQRKERAERLDFKGQGQTWKNLHQMNRRPGTCGDFGHQGADRYKGA